MNIITKEIDTTPELETPEVGLKITSKDLEGNLNLEPEKLLEKFGINIDDINLEDGYIKEGIMSKKDTSIINAVVEVKLNDENLKNPVKNKLVSLIVEAIQNLYFHSNDKNNSFMLKKEGDAFNFSTRNYISKEAKEELKSKLDILSSMDEKELKEKYRYEMNNGDFSEKGTAGLGFIDLFKKTKGNVDYKFEQIDKDGNIFDFTITGTVKRKKKKDGGLIA